MVSYQNRLNSLKPRATVGCCVSGRVAGGHLFETAVPGAEASSVKAEVTLYKTEEQMSGPTVPPAQSLRLQVRFLWMMVQLQSGVCAPALCAGTGPVSTREGDLPLPAQRPSPFFGCSTSPPNRGVSFSSPERASVGILSMTCWPQGKGGLPIKNRGFLAWTVKVKTKTPQQKVTGRPPCDTLDPDGLFQKASGDSASVQSL